MSTINTPALLPGPDEFNMYQTIARNAQTSGLYGGVGSEAKIFMVLLAARELGISPMLALNGGIWNIQGKIEISARLMNGLIRRAGHSITIIKSDDTICTLKGKRTDGDEFEVTFSIEDAKKAGLANRDVWLKYPSDMLYNRCMSRLCRRLFSDVVGAAYVEGEIREAKEIEQQEKRLQNQKNQENQLEMAECQDITNDRYQPPVEPPATPSPSPPVEKISDEQISELKSLFNQLSSDSQKNLWDLSNKKHGLIPHDWVTVTQPIYSWMKNGMTLSINANKVKEESGE